jgi:cell wall assembly regulator SMI1
MERLMSMDASEYMELCPPASADAIAAAEGGLGVRFPESYRRFLLSSNGAVGFSDQKGLLRLWKVEELVSQNTDYQVQLDAPGFVIIGTDGGGEAFAFDCRSQSSEVYAIPFVSMDPEDAESRASTFDEFVEPYMVLRPTSKN